MQPFFDAPPARVTFAATMCLLDPASGAAQSVRAILETLAAGGIQATAFTGSLFDGPGEVPFAEVLSRRAAEPDAEGKVVYFDRRGMRHYVYRTASSLGPNIRPDEKTQLQSRVIAHLRETRPDAVLSFGGSDVGAAIRAAARAIGARVIWYFGREIDDTLDVQPQDRIIACSTWLAETYGARYGVPAAVINPVIDRSRLADPESGIAAHPALRQLGLLTFVNPMPQKGLTLVARLAERAIKERPAMRFLVLEGRMTRAVLQGRGLDLGQLRNVWFLQRQREMAAVWARTSILLMPSFWAEGFGRSVIEAHLSGVPVLGSDRGGVPEALGGVRPLHIPPEMGQQMWSSPPSETVDLWWEALTRLWDDEAAYAEARAAALIAAAEFHPEASIARVRHLFGLG
ncbi:MAG: glycosyltransferase family 4 protein [Pseudomonadota bacterium]